MSGSAVLIYDHMFLSFHLGVQCWTSGLLLQTWRLHYPQCILAAGWHHWRQFIRLDTAPSGATKKVVLLFHTCSRTCQNLYKYNLSSIWETSTHSNSPRSHRITVLLKCIRLSRLSMPRELICDFRMQVCILNARLTRRAVPPPGYDTEGINYHVFEGTI